MEHYIEALGEVNVIKIIKSNEELNNVQSDLKEIIEELEKEPPYTIILSDLTL